MRTASLRHMHKGWFVGDFTPTVFATPDCEMAIKRYCAGESEAAHVHRIATEITVIISGRVRMNGQEFGPDDIIILDPGTPADFCALEDTITAVAKVPCVAGDKYDLPSHGNLP